MPFTRKNKEHVSGFDIVLSSPTGLQYTFTFYNVQKLVFRKHSSVLGLEEIFLIMILRGIVFSCGNLLITH